MEASPCRNREGAAAPGANAGSTAHTLVTVVASSRRSNSSVTDAYV